MGWDIPQGTVPAGVTPRTMDEQGNIGGYSDNNQFSMFVRELQKYVQKQQLEQEKIQKREQEKLDMYKTLRDAGYEPEAAHKAVMSGMQFPQQAGGMTPEEKKSEVEIESKKSQTQLDSARIETEKTRQNYYSAKAKETGVVSPESQARINKINAEIEKINAEKKEDPNKIKEQELKVAKLEAEIEKINAESADVPKKSKIEDKIANKIVNGEALTTGEQRYYNEQMIRKPGVLKGITPNKALDIISDPFKSMAFKKKYPELYAQLEQVAQSTIAPQQPAQSKYSIGQIIKKGGKTYKVVSIDPDGEPRVDPVR